jgi:hypothetical protein
MSKNLPYCSSQATCLFSTVAQLARRQIGAIKKKKFLNQIYQAVL